MEGGSPRVIEIDADASDTFLVVKGKIQDVTGCIVASMVLSIMMCGVDCGDYQTCDGSKHAGTEETGGWKILDDARCLSDFNVREMQQFAARILEPGQY